MRQYKITKLQYFFQSIEKYKKYITIFVIVLLPSIYFLVYFNGGTKNVYAHMMYIPIVIAGAILGLKWGVFLGLLAGVLLGPFMPLDTATDEMQSFFNWFFRLICFVIIGGFNGLVSTTLRKNTKMILKLMSFNPETEIPNINIYNNKDALSYDRRHQIKVTILINNNDRIIDLLGLEPYYQLLNNIYNTLRKGLAHTTLIVQCNNNKFWMATPFKDLPKDINQIYQLILQGSNINNVNYYIEFSLGVSFAINQSECYNSLAYTPSDDAARYAQKNNLKYFIYESSIKRTVYDLNILDDFKQALKSNEVALYYQPKINLQTGELNGLEALIRWRHPEKGIIMANEFISLIEETQLIHQLMEWVLLRIIDKIRRFNKESIKIKISMNISVKNIFDKNNFDRVKEIIKENSDIVDYIEFEIMESVFIDKIDEIIEILKMYRQIGISFSVDDFGKGYSSLAYLHDLPIDCVKIDRSFTKNLYSDRANQNILKAIVKLCHDLNYTVVLEGVEDKKTGEIAKNLGCDMVQGFYYARPIADDSIIDWYKNRLSGQ